MDRDGARRDGGARRRRGPGPGVPRRAKLRRGVRGGALHPGSRTRAAAPGARAVAAVAESQREHHALAHGGRVERSRHRAIRALAQHQQLHAHAVAAAVPPAKPGAVQPGGFPGEAGGSDLCARHPGPRGARRAGVLRRARRAGHAGAGRGAEGGDLGAAGAGEAQFRSRHRDHHRHARGAGALRPHRLPGDRGAERRRQPPPVAAAHHRQGLRPPGAAAGRRAARAAQPEPDAGLGRPRRKAELRGAGSGGDRRNRAARGAARERRAHADARPGRDPRAKHAKRHHDHRDQRRPGYDQQQHRAAARRATLPGR